MKIAPPGAKNAVHRPLFTSYLLLGDDLERIEALRNRPANVLDVPDQTNLAHDLRQIHQMISSGLTVVLRFPSCPWVRTFGSRPAPWPGSKVKSSVMAAADQFIAIVQFLEESRRRPRRLGRST